MVTKTVDKVKAGELLRSMREARGWSRPQLANRADVAEATIRNIEKNYRSDGKDTLPYPRTIGRLAKQFGREDGMAILEVFGCSDLATTIFHEDEPLVGGTGLKPEQEAMIERIVEALIELARSGNDQPSAARRLVDLSSYRANPRYVKSPQFAVFSQAV